MGVVSAHEEEMMSSDAPGVDSEAWSGPAPPSVSELLRQVPPPSRPLAGCVMVSRKSAEVVNEAGETLHVVERHTALRVAQADGDGNLLPSRRDGRVAVSVQGRLGYVEAGATREPDELDALAMGGGAAAVKLASALRTDNLAKLRAGVAKCKDSAALVERAKARLQKHAVETCCDGIDQAASLSDVRMVRRAATKARLDAASVAKIDRRGRFLAGYAALCGDPTAKREHEMEGAMLADVGFLDEMIALASSSADEDRLDVLKLKRRAADEAAAQSQRGGDRSSSSTGEIVHAFSLQGEHGGFYARVVAGHGVQDGTGDRFHTYEMRRGQPVFAHVFRTSRAFVLDRPGRWVLVDDFRAAQDDERVGQATTSARSLSTSDLTDPRAYRPAGLVQHVRLCTIHQVCLARKLEGNLYYERRDYDAAVALYTLGIELAPECDDDDLSLALLLNRAQARTKQSSGRRLPTLRAALADLEKARVFARDDDPRLPLKLAKVHALLGDRARAVTHLKTALALTSSADPAASPPRIRAELAEATRLVRAG